MANDLTTRPLKIDTAMAGGTSLARPIRVIKVYWFNPTAAGDTFTILDPVSSKVLLQGRAEAANQSQVFEFEVPQEWKDFRVSVLTAGGTLFIYTV